MWDLPIDSMAQAPTIEQMQQLEKAKTAKVNGVSASFSCLGVNMSILLYLYHKYIIPNFTIIRYRYKCLLTVGAGEA